MTPNTPPPSRRAPRAPLPPLDPVRASYLVQLAAALDADPLLDAHVLRLACARRQRKTARSIMPESRKIPPAPLQMRAGIREKTLLLPMNPMVENNLHLVLDSRIGLS